MINEAFEFIQKVIVHEHICVEIHEQETFHISFHACFNTMKWYSKYNKVNI